ncbi:uncharacterized protein AKAME5_002117000 [Lates japonicus]|uniref:Uncharacterized protein n=1 Tax=Lates japonicus TaxID=270547 RepID=A0AAD3NB61_LATJO|nr:uncharacterized protein AKAME5_002117000 [Lates japonicus]
MSIFERLAPLIPQVSASSRQTREHPSVCLSPPLSLSSPVIKKKAIHIPSFDEKGLIHEKHNTKQMATDRSFVPICSSKTSSQPSWSKSCQHSQRIHGERASTLPRTKPKTYSSPTLSAKPSISIFPAPKPNSFPTPSTLKPKPSDSLHLPASELSDLSPLLHQPQPKPSVSPTLTVPTPRLSPSPTSLCQGMSLDGQGGKQPSPVAKERRARSITISNTKVEPKQSFSNEAKHDILDQEALLDFTHPELRRSCPRTSGESRHQTHSESQKQAPASHSSHSLQGKLGLSNKENSSKDKPKPPPRNLDFSAIPKPQSDIKQQQEFLPSGATDWSISTHQVPSEKQILVKGPESNCPDGCTEHSHEQSLEQNKKQKEVKLSDTGLNQTDIFVPPDHHHHHSAPTKLLEYPSEKCVVSGPPSVARCPFNTNSSGTGSKGVFDLQSQPQHRAYQRPEETTTSTTASLPPKQVDYSQANRAFIMEEPEDPYYVTMYYPGSVYVGE